MHDHVKVAGISAAAWSLSLRLEWKLSGEGIDVFALDWVLSDVGRIYNEAYFIIYFSMYD